MTATQVTNATPAYDPTDNPTNCCPRFKPELWDGQELHFENKPFVSASTVSLFHVPLNMGSVFARTWNAIKDAHAEDGGFLVLSHEDSAWHAEHLFAVSRPVPGSDMVSLSGDFLTKVFEGPYEAAKRWADEMTHYVNERGHRLDTLYFFYTTCPKCAKYYGKNYVVGVAKVK
ncbi:MAG TPA: hydrolase [Vicinamibacterales bacterium]|nr:hydrolase [Vicinamibacterales bacterium]